MGDSRGAGERFRWNRACIDWSDARSFSRADALRVVVVVVVVRSFVCLFARRTDLVRLFVGRPAQTRACEVSGVDWSASSIEADVRRSLESRTSTSKVLVAVPAPGERLESDARVVGSVGFCVCAGGETQITQIATRPSIRRRGLGSRMLKAMLGLDPSAVGVLEVRATNEAALAMYEKCGFQRAGVRAKYYSDGVDAVCMTREPGERPVSTRELTRLLAGLSSDAARKPAPPLPELAEATPRPVVDVPRQGPAFTRGDSGEYKMRNRIRRTRPPS